MAEENQVQQVTMKDPQKVEVGKRLAEYNRRKREELAQMKAQKSESIVVIGFLDVISYYRYQSKTLKESPVNQPKEAPVHQPKETPANKFVVD